MSRIAFIVARTTFVPLFLGMSAIVRAVDDSANSWDISVGKYVGVFIVALALARPYSAIPLAKASSGYDGDLD